MPTRDPWCGEVWFRSLSFFFFVHRVDLGTRWACLTICIGVSLQTVVKSYYELLGLKASDDMTSKDIEKAFRKRSLVSHPDKGKPQSALQDPWPWQNVVFRVPCFELVLLTLVVQSRRADSRPQVGTQLSSFS